MLALTEFLCEGLQQKGYRILSPRGAGERSGIVVFNSDRYGNDLLFKRLTAEEIHVSQRGDGIRVSPHYDNTENELQQLLDILL